MRETSLVKRTEFIGAPDSARVVTRRRRVRLGDAAPSGTVRLDALARYLQDIADDDVIAQHAAEHALLRLFALRRQPIWPSMVRGHSC